MPGDILIQAIYENLNYAIENGLKERFLDWEDYDWIFSDSFLGDREPLEEIAVIREDTLAS